MLDDVHGNYDVVEEDNVAVLTRHNFNHVLHSKDYVLVEFYAPWLVFIITQIQKCNMKSQYLHLIYGLNILMVSFNSLLGF